MHATFSIQDKKVLCMWRIVLKRTDDVKTV